MRFTLRTGYGSDWRPLAMVAFLMWLACLTDYGRAQEAAPAVPEAIPGYEDQIMRLSEILGALHFLREICGSGDSALWRGEMESLLEAEAPGPARRVRLIARFNHGFETLNAVYRSCTPAARHLMANYLAEGRSIADDIRLRYSQ